ncbi:MAG: DUF6445 family protein [Asticcacaulis sp.]
MTMEPNSFVPRFNASARISARRIGREQQPLLIIDNVLQNPQDMVDLAGLASFSKPQNSAYPGLNAEAPPAYARALAEALRPLMSQGFGLLPKGTLRFFSFMGLTTMGASEMRPIQRIPHFDSTDPYRLAVVHYFCDPAFGGTGFFRHQSTGFETVTADRVAMFDRQMSEELKQGVPEVYTGLKTPYFEPLDKVDAAFNRLIVYRNNCFHAALLGGATLSDDPRKGRLTVNSFISAEA